MREYRVSSPAEMRALGAEFARSLRAGDVVILSGDLGAGKTTFTQGVGQGLGVTEPITSPTFIIARTHETTTGLSLIHVDAYRVGSVVELDDLDLDSELSAAVVVVEWGAGKADALGEEPYYVEISRSRRYAPDSHDPLSDSSLRMVKIFGGPHVASN